MKKQLSLLTLLALAACGGGAGSSIPASGSAAQPQLQNVAVQFSITIPKADGRVPQYISTATQSAKITVTPTGGSPLTPVVIPCTSTCQGTVPAPVGSDTFAVVLYDQAAAAGNILSQGSATQTILAGQANSVNVTFGGVIAGITLAANAVNLKFGTPATVPLTITATDAAGKTIVGTYATAIALSDTDGSGVLGLSATSVPSSSTAITMAYSGAGLAGGAGISAASGGVQSTVLQIQTPKAACTSGAIFGYYPCDLQSAYNLPSATQGAGQTMAIVDAMDDPNAEADLGVYRTQFGLSACTTANGCFKKVNQTGGTTYPTGDTGWAGEISLDLDMASAICPNCKILLVESTDATGNNLGLAVNEAATLGATVISNSYGGVENSQAQVDHDDANYFGIHPGIAITASTGDNGYQEGVNSPASSRFVTAVGGTNLLPAANARGWTETAWGSVATPTHGAGSGCSAYSLKPAWQHDTGCAKRMIADVSANADPQTGVAVYDSYGAAPGAEWGVVGGTSESAPIVAGVYALAGNAASVTNPAQLPYLAGSGTLNDVTSGTNGVENMGASPAQPCSGSTIYFCNAEVGFDGPTGLGTPNGAGGAGAGAFAMLRDQLQVSALALRMRALQSLPSKRLCSDPAPGHYACFALKLMLPGRSAP